MKQWLRHDIAVPRWLCIVWVFAGVNGMFLSILVLTEGVTT